MACACGKNKAAAVAKTFVVTAKDGTKKTFKSEVEAAAAARRLEGSYKAA